jgi:hypothetical protein
LLWLDNQTWVSDPTYAIYCDRLSIRPPLFTSLSPHTHTHTHTHRYASEHQLAVIDCLEDPDVTLKKKTLELLYKMTKPDNVEVGGCLFFHK